MPGPGSRKRSRKGVSAWEGFDPWRGPCRRSFRADARDYLRSLLLSASGDDTLALTLHYNGATDSAAREMKLIFNSWNLQRIDNMNKSALEKRLGTTFPLIAGMGRDQASAS